MNMSYCAFENTLKDLYQVKDIAKKYRNWEEFTSDASEHEIQAAKDMIWVLKELHEDLHSLYYNT